jgi:type VI secretion system protein ImpC
MTQPWSLKSFAIGLTAGAPGASEQADEDAPFRVALLGNFSGRPRTAATPLDRLRPVVIDRDNFEEVLARLAPTLALPLSGVAEPLRLSFRELDDFHPDRLYQRLELFQALRDLRKRLDNPNTFAAAAAELRSWGNTAATQPAASPPPAEGPPASALSPEELLAQLLGEAPPAPRPPGPGPAGSDWNAYLEKIVGPHLVRSADPRQAELTAQVDAATAAQMRAVLHHPDFQALEAAWRAVYFLVRRLDTDAKLKLYLVDVTKAELAADLGAAEDLRTSGTYKLLVEQTVGTAGGQAWAVLAGNYTFGLAAEDVHLLARVGAVARAAGAPFLAAADSRLFCPSLADTPDPDDWPRDRPEGTDMWDALRRLPEATSLGLAMPRFLLRLPYGRESDAAEQFDFEELPEGSRHEDYLWGNPAFACAYLLAENFSRRGWDLRPDDVRDIDNLPLHVYRDAGESQLKPCAEVLLRDRAVERILDQGVMPLVSVQGQPAVRLARFQSLAEPAAPLAGRWQ